MRISLKNKLQLGFGFLFLMIILLWITGGFFIYDLSNRSASMLKENYQTVESTKHLIQAIDEVKNRQTRDLFSSHDLSEDSIYNKNLRIFRENLAAVKSNITEPGEEWIIEDIEHSFYQLLETYNNIDKSGDSLSIFYLDVIIPTYSITRNEIMELMDMNMDAISHKNGEIRNTASRAFIIISVIGTICFIISALFLFRYPSNITRPMGELTAGIKQIARRNYEQRLSFQSNDELGELAEAFNSMAAKLDEYEHSNLSQVLFEKKRIDTIINNMKDAIIGLNDEQEIIFSNALACGILNISSDEMVGKQAGEVASRNSLFRKIMKDVFNENHKTRQDFNVLKITEKGRMSYYLEEVLDVEIVKTGESDPVNVGVVIVLKNITRFLEHDEAKTNFIATISHELKTPISSLRLNLKLLNDHRIGDMNEEQREILEVLKQETDKMLNITSELLNLAQMETGNIQMNLHAVDPAKVIEYVRDNSLNYAKDKNLKITFEFDDDLPKVLCDPERTAWVLNNFIVNAIHYSGNDSEIRIEVRRIGNKVRFMVQDFGRGIEKKYLDKIFEKFFRVPGADQKGTGLGLAISEEFINKQKGDIWVESDPGEGSRFFFNLPIYTEGR